MKNKLKIIIPILIAVIAVVLTVVLVFISSAASQKKEIEDILSKAQDYLDDEEYEKAVKSFKKVIEADDMNVEAYIGIAQAYEGLGDTDKAIEWLEEGYDLTDDDSLEEEIDRIFDSTNNAESEITTIAEVDYITIKGEQYSTSLTSLDLSGKDLTDDDIKDLKYMTNLTELHLGWNQISDISALSNLTNLETLWLLGNQISDISALSDLTNLTHLNLSFNQIRAISALSNLTNLTELNLGENQISDISALSNLTNLMSMSLRDNQISQEEVDKLKEELPNCIILY